MPNKGNNMYASQHKIWHGGRVIYWFTGVDHCFMLNLALTGKGDGEILKN